MCECVNWFVWSQTKPKLSSPRDKFGSGKKASQTSAESRMSLFCTHDGHRDKEVLTFLFILSCS